ncbi:hypothetical protein B0H16DRAFT_1715755 [Mycena metata]|uniref:Alpha-type protein kinase domain-containing protein n=1 Tax=Mycena metata TaxID=1033252 RepID=A0AAD7JS10_9AGAR|nr:hypothetical protein B0H16DRAFT_1715755 [Mycena metata]
MTVKSFLHFILEDSACTMAFTDLKGFLHTKLGQARSMCLFDPMTHTLFQESGVGDFGGAGIQDVIETHECNLFCEGLNLSTKAVLKNTFVQQKKEYGIEAETLV